MKKYGLLLVALWVGALPAAERFHHPSGLLARLVNNDNAEPALRGKREEVVGEVLQSEVLALFPVSISEKVTWHVFKSIEDKLHHHLTYRAKYLGFDFESLEVVVHWNKQGFLEYLVSVIDRVPEFEFEPQEVAQAKANVARVKTRFQTMRTLSNQRVTPRQEVFPVWMRAPGEKKHQLFFEVMLSHEAPFLRRHFFYSLSRGEIAFERSTLRQAARDIYPISPDGGAATQVTLPRLTGSTLSDSSFHVYREQDITTVERVDVDPSSDYTGSGFFDANDPYSAPLYRAICDTGSTDGSCPNQSQEAVNVYYHLDNYRQNINAYFSTLGVNPSLGLDPITVVVNTLVFGTDQANNAFYASELQTSSGSFVDGGIFFFRPASATCEGTGSTVQWFHVARESLVVVHEYQHYLTDKITRMISGSGGAKNVGDALHEGYSDYFAASQISRLSGQNVTKIGEYAFKNCTAIQRDISSLIKESEVPQIHGDQYQGGYSWASGLWKLRTELGREKMDLLALKSLFFLSTRPGYIEAVEALAQADVALNGGANTATIRRLFYETLEFTGAGSAMFRNASEGDVEVGFQSCASVSLGGHAPALSWGGALAWLLLTLLVGRVAFQTRRA